MKSDIAHFLPSRDDLTRKQSIARLFLLDLVGVYVLSKVWLKITGKKFLRTGMEIYKRTKQVFNKLNKIFYLKSFYKNVYLDNYTFL